MKVGPRYQAELPALEASVAARRDWPASPTRVRVTSRLDVGCAWVVPVVVMGALMVTLASIPY